MIWAQTPPPLDLEGIASTTILTMIVVVLFLATVMGGLLWIGWWSANRRGTVSPYSGEPMAKGEDLAFSAIQSVEDYLMTVPQPGVNPKIDFMRSAICRRTGRIFPESITRFGTIKLNWSFLNRRHPGTWVSWGSLSESEQALIRSRHLSLDGYQIETSCSLPRPEAVDAYHGLGKPGPLYVDLGTLTLMGWKCVPGTSLEVLIVSLPEVDAYS